MRSIRDLIFTVIKTPISCTLVGKTVNLLAYADDLSCYSSILESNAAATLWCCRSRGISSASGTKITSLETRDSRLSYGENPESLSHLALNPYRVVTDRRTEFP